MKNYRTEFIRRQYMRAKDFELYYYEDRNPSMVEAHSHDYCEIYFFLEGNVSLQIGDRLFPLVPGNVALLHPGVVHRAVIAEGTQVYRRFVLWLKTDYLAALLADPVLTDEAQAELGFFVSETKESGAGVLSFDMIEFNELQGRLYRILEELRGGSFAGDAAIALGMRGILIQLSRRMKTAQTGDRPDEGRTLCDSMIAYIENHLAEDLSLERLGREFYVNRYHVSHVFRENMGISVYQYILKKRLSVCRDAILSGQKVTEVCLQTGFHDYTSFYRAFRKEYGLSPREYRDTALGAAGGS